MVLQCLYRYHIMMLLFNYKHNSPVQCQYSFFLSFLLVWWWVWVFVWRSLAINVLKNISVDKMRTISFIYIYSIRVIRWQKLCSFWCHWWCCLRLNGNHNAFSSTLFFIIGRWFSCCRCFHTIFFSSALCSSLFFHYFAIQFRPFYVCVHLN